MEQEIFESLAIRQLQGTIFHSDMADYYNLLDLKQYANFHNNQFLEENETYRKIKNYFIKKYHVALIINNITFPKNIIINIQNDSIKNDLTNYDTLNLLIKQSLNEYKKWEEETYSIYNELSNKLFEKECFDDYCFIKNIIRDVKEEIEDIDKLIIKLYYE